MFISKGEIDSLTFNLPPICESDTVNRKVDTLNRKGDTLNRKGDTVNRKHF
jgi:hypothetical protein